MSTITNELAPSRIRSRSGFRNKNATFRARWMRLAPRGDMPDSAWRLLQAALKAAGSKGVYVVLSYDTPIAWASESAPLLTVPNVRYSNTTTRHQQLAQGGPIAGEYTVVGLLTDAGDPGAVRAGRGASPYGPREGW